ncbi:MAG: hypothetical protein EA376_06160 [Phycisphaeraceae bacterium]|nr:MAG: hypothetical protein EA376_06160 [Phycisphaeraceae bacterium]
MRWFGIAIVLLLSGAAHAVAGDEPLSVTPASGGLGTVITIVSTEQTAIRNQFNATTTVQWEGLYVSPMQEESAPFTVTYSAKDVMLIDEWRISVVLGGGSISPKPNIESLAGFGVLEGTVTTTTQIACQGDINGDGVVNAQDLAILLSFWGTSEKSADLNDDGVVNAQDLAILLSWWGSCTGVLTTVMNFAPETDAARWSSVTYIDGFGGIFPPRLLAFLDELPMYLLSLTPDPMNPTAEQFAAGASNHLAMVLDVRRNASSELAAPTSIFVDVVMYDAAGMEMNRAQGIELMLQSEQPDSKVLLYHNDLQRPVILIDTPIDTKAFPDFHLIFGAADGSAAIVPSTSD